MDPSFWHTLKQNIRETYDFIWALDRRATGVIEEGLSLLWQDIRAFFAE